MAMSVGLPATVPVTPSAFSCVADPSRSMAKPVIVPVPALLT